MGGDKVNECSQLHKCSTAYLVEELASRGHSGLKADDPQHEGLAANHPQHEDPAADHPRWGG